MLLHHVRPSRPLIALAVAMAMVLGACSNTGSPSAAASGGGSSAGAVTIQNVAFDPTSISVAVGTTVTWTNRDSVEHTVTADDGSFDSQTIAPGATFSQTFSNAGTFTYHCKIPSAMKATVIVH